MEESATTYGDNSAVITRRRRRSTRRALAFQRARKRAVEQDLRIAERLIPELKAAPWAQGLCRHDLLALANYEPGEQRVILEQADTPLGYLLEERAEDAARALIGQHRTIGVPPAPGVCWIGTRFEDEWAVDWKEDPRILLISPAEHPHFSTVQGIFVDPGYGSFGGDGDFAALEKAAEESPLEFAGRKVVRWAYREQPLPASQLWGFLCLSGWSLERRYWRAMRRE